MVITETFVRNLVADMTETPQGEVNGQTIIPERFQTKLVQLTADAIRIHLQSLPKPGLRVGEIVGAVKQLGG